MNNALNLKMKGRNPSKEEKDYLKIKERQLFLFYS